jgi:hypothetical protein
MYELRGRTKHSRVWLYDQRGRQANIHAQSLVEREDGQVVGMLSKLVVDELGRAGAGCEIFDVVSRGQDSSDGKNIVQNRGIV